MNDILTVVTPTVRGREHLLAECVASVTDAGLPHSIMVDEQREGPSIIRNRIIEAVKTPWIVCLDDDDLIYPNYLEIVEPHLKDKHAIFTNWDLSGADSPQPASIAPEVIPELLQLGNFIPVTVTMQTELVKQVGGFPNVHIEEDHALWKALLSLGVTFEHVPVKAWHYRRIPGSRTDTR